MFRAIGSSQSIINHECRWCAADEKNYLDLLKTPHLSSCYAQHLTICALFLEHRTHKPFRAGDLEYTTSVRPVFCVGWSILWQNMSASVWAKTGPFNVGGFTASNWPNLLVPQFPDDDGQGWTMSLGVSTWRLESSRCWMGHLYDAGATYTWLLYIIVGTIVIHWCATPLH